MSEPLYLVNLRKLRTTKTSALNAAIDYIDDLYTTRRQNKPDVRQCVGDEREPHTPLPAADIVRRLP